MPCKAASRQDRHKGRCVSAAAAALVLSLVRWFRVMVLGAKVGAVGVVIRALPANTDVAALSQQGRRRLCADEGHAPNSLTLQGCLCVCVCVIMTQRPLAQGGSNWRL